MKLYNYTLKRNYFNKIYNTSPYNCTAYEEVIKEKVFEVNSISDNLIIINNNERSYIYSISTIQNINESSLCSLSKLDENQMDKLKRYFTKWCE